MRLEETASRLEENACALDGPALCVDRTGAKAQAVAGDDDG